MSDREAEDKKLQTGNTQRSQQQQPASGLGINAAIGKQLKAYYDDVASEPVPDRFLSLLDALDEAETASKKNDRE
ncbi:NepR family anti-sigma factor [Jiella pelagia]|uniref:NepR family anti-sigma factor n=1 Tax=Jiella pelagia TaxID=2986949 RepID=A0ABY7C186_9HYPH|nr:NepR family anti-sigma factor [Jiella pelagia]WAP69522.1 NepR family anti-sigma factor [Jiella pelagia]